MQPAPARTADQEVNKAVPLQTEMTVSDGGVAKFSATNLNS
jgi:hypothetical protein